MEEPGMEFVRTALIGLAVCLVGALPCARAAVDEVSAQGFVVSHEVTIAAGAQQVYEQLVDEVGRWWSSAHTFSGEAKNLRIEARPGGCFCETLPAGGGVEHLRVVQVKPGRLIRMSGALGPLQGHGLAGSMTWSFTSVEGGTKVALRYSVGGFLGGGFEPLAPAVDRVLGEQLNRLKLFAETGDPMAKEGE
jgi:uncharacterized protein YndB with AHSA1/START domain